MLVEETPTFLRSDYASNNCTRLIVRVWKKRDQLVVIETGQVALLDFLK